MPNFISVTLEINLTSFVLAAYITLGEGEMTVFLFFKENVNRCFTFKMFFMCMCLVVSKTSTKHQSIKLQWHLH